MIKRLLAIVLTAWLPLHAALAVKMPDLYLITIPVATQSDEAREQAVQDGFMQVLTKLSGDAHIDVNPMIKENLKRADYYVQEFSYSQPTMSASQYYLQIRYSKDDVNRLLKRASVGFWGDNRPLILVWLAETDVENNTTTLIGNETPGDLLNIVETQSKKYGLPMILPLLDVTDLNEVSFNDVAAMTLPVLQSAAKRYAPDAMLIGKMQKNTRGIDSQWILLSGKKRWNWTLATTLSADAVNKIIDATMIQVSQFLAGHGDVRSRAPDHYWIKLQVSHLEQQADVNQMLDYVKQLAQVQQVVLGQVSDDAVQFAVQLNGPLDTFKQNMLKNQHLALTTTETAKDKLFYTWVQ